MAVALQDFLFADDPEQVLRQHYSDRIEQARASARSAPPLGRPPRLLLAGYSGAYNTGADARTGEIVRQLRRLFPDGVEIGAVCVGAALPADWGGVQAEPITGHPPDFVHDLCARYDAVIVCEGSLFTSTFSDGLAGLLTAFLGMATAQGKPAVALGAEADQMNPEIEAFVLRHARDALIIARNQPSAQRLAALGLAVEEGADTGWSFTPTPPRPAHELLRQRGWNGEAEVVVLCPITPFRWPLRADPQRALALKLEGRRDPDHYGGFSFFRPEQEVATQQAAFLDAIAQATERYGATRRQGIFPLVVGMEALDATACADLAARLGASPPLVAGQDDAHTLVSLVRAADRLISGRFHAVLLSMAAGVPAVGLASDQRLKALLAEAGCPDLALPVEAADLEERLFAALTGLAGERGARVHAAFQSLAEDRRAVQGAMGQRLLRHLTDGWGQR